METMDLLLQAFNHELNYAHTSLAIIPTVLIPLTGLAVIASSIATVVASWFGIKLKTEGPKQLLEVLLTKKVILSAIILNLAFFGATKAYHYVKTSAVPLFYIEYKSGQLKKISAEKQFEDNLTRIHSYNNPNLEKDNDSLTLSLKEVWVEKIPKGAFRSITPSSQSLFLGADDGFVYELSSSSGKINRTFYVGTQVTTRPVILKNKLYVGEGNHETHHARIYAFDLLNGHFINAFETIGHTEGQPIALVNKSTDTLLVTAGKDGLYAVDAQTMKPLWHVNDGHLDATVSVEGEKVFAGTGKEKGLPFDRSYASAYDLNTGNTLWKKELPLSNWMHPILSTQDVCYVLGEIYTESDVGFFYCLNKNNGEASFSIPFNSPLVGKPLYIKSNQFEYAFVSGMLGEICAINITTKNKLWCHETGTKKTNYALNSFSYDPKRNVLWYASFDNGLYALSPSSGKILLHWFPEKNSTSPWKKTMASASIEGDSIYLVDLKGFIRRLNIEMTL